MARDFNFSRFLNALNATVDALDRAANAKPMWMYVRNTHNRKITTWATRELAEAVAQTWREKETFAKVRVKEHGDRFAVQYLAGTKK